MSKWVLMYVAADLGFGHDDATVLSIVACVYDVVVYMHDLHLVMVGGGSIRVAALVTCIVHVA